MVLRIKTKEYQKEENTERKHRNGKYHKENTWGESSRCTGLTWVLKLWLLQQAVPGACHD